MAKKITVYVAGLNSESLEDRPMFSTAFEADRNNIQDFNGYGGVFRLTVRLDWTQAVPVHPAEV